MTPSPPVPAGLPASTDRLSHLFRASLKQGRFHPLYLPLLKYRQSRAEAGG